MTGREQSSSLAEARRLLAESDHIVAFSGAGLSAESGVPTFRDAATDGHWTRHDPTRLASPSGFADDPALVLRWYAERRQNLATVQPNAAHEALAAAEHSGRLINVTQNVDGLLQRAGATQTIPVHGSITSDRCHAGCGYTEEVVLARADAAQRRCPDCGAALRPAVVWFGEALPSDIWAAAEDACRACDAMLVIGTAAEVWPAAGLIDCARERRVPIIVVNTNPSAASACADVELLEAAGRVVPLLLADA